MRAGRPAAVQLRHHPVPSLASACGALRRILSPFFQNQRPAEAQEDEKSPSQERFGWRFRAERTAAAKGKPQQLAQYPTFESRRGVGAPRPQPRQLLYRWSERAPYTTAE